MTAQELGAAFALEETTPAVARLWEAHMADADARKAADDLRVPEEADAIQRASTAITAALALADALRCPVAWCTADHTADAYRFENDAYVSLCRHHVTTVGGFKLDAFENVGADGTRTVEPPMLTAPEFWEGPAGVLVDDIRDAIAALQALAATLAAASGADQ